MDGRDSSLLQITLYCSWSVTNWLRDAFSKLCAAVLHSGEYGCLKLLSCFEQDGDKINGNFALEQY